MFYSIQPQQVQDLCIKFPEKDCYFLTANLQTRAGDTFELSQTTNRIIRAWNYDALLVVEHYQFHGRTAIFAPHVHAIIRCGPSDALSMAKAISDANVCCDTDVRGVYDTRGLLRYFVMDSSALHFLQKRYT